MSRTKDYQEVVIFAAHLVGLRATKRKLVKLAQVLLLIEQLDGATADVMRALDREDECAMCALKADQ